MPMISDATVKKYSRTAGKRSDVDEFMTPALIVQRLFGLQILDPDWTWTRYIFNQIFTISVIVYVIFGTVEVLQNATDVKLIAEAYYTIIITIVCPVKYFLFVHNRATFQELYVCTKTTLYDFVKDDSQEKGHNVLKNVKLIVKFLFCVVLLPVITYFMTAMYYYGIGNRVTLSKSTSILMPMTSPSYEIGLILHTIFLFEMSFILLVIDMWFVFLMFMYCVCSDSLVKLLMVKKQFGETEEAYQGRLNDSLRRFYNAHERQNEYLNVLTNMYKWPTVVPLCNVLLCICVTLLLLSKELDWKFAPNLLPPLAEIFAYSWFGEQIKTKALNLNMALLHFDWTSMKLKDKKNYLIIISYMNKGFGIKTAFGNDLSLITMSVVLKASYQTFAVMKTMDS